MKSKEGRSDLVATLLQPLGVGIKFINDSHEYMDRVKRLIITAHLGLKTTAAMCHQLLLSQKLLEEGLLIMERVKSGDANLGFMYSIPSPHRRQQSSNSCKQTMLINRASPVMGQHVWRLEDMRPKLDCQKSAMSS